MRAILLIAAPLILAGCESREIASICVSTGDPAAELRAAFHDADGTRAILLSDAETGTVAEIRDTLDPPILTRLWRLAEPTMRALAEVEPSPCGPDTVSAVVVTFADGSSIVRETSCTGNALARVTREVLEASDMERLSETPAAAGVPAPPDTVLAACARLS